MILMYICRHKPPPPMKDAAYTKMMTEAPFGAAYHKIILDDKDKPVDYVFLEVNRAFERLTGLKAKDILNKRITEAIPGIEKGEFSWIDFYGRIALEGKSQDFEQYSEPLKRWYKVYAFSPERQYFVTIFADTTREKLMHEELNRFFSINLDLLCIADTAGNFVKVNKSWEDILGYSIEELENKKFLSFVHPEDMQATLDALLDLKANKPVMNFVNRYRSKDGSYRSIEWRSHSYGQFVYSAARDVTERLKSEIRLRDMEKRLSAAQNFASVGSWEYNINEGTLYWSKECESLFGLDEGEFEGTFEDFLKRVHPDDRELVINTNQPITDYRDAKPLEYEHRIITKSGEVRWVRESAGLMKDVLGKPKKIAGLVMDVTKQKNAEELLVKSERRYRGLVESQSDLIVRVDAHNHFTFVNDAYCKTFGKSSEELIGKSFTPLVHEDDIASTFEAMKDLEKPPYRCSVVQRAMTKDGWRWLHWEDNAILDGDGNILEIQGVGRDITELKEAEEALRISESRTISLLAETPAVIYSYGYMNGTPDIDYINENVESVLGYKPEYFLHNFKAWADCVHPDDLEKNRQRLAETITNLKDGQESYFEYRFRDSTGNYHWLSDRQKVLIDNDGNTKVVGVWVDISKEIEAREAIENEEKLRQIVDNIDGVFWLRSADRNEMLYVSPSIEPLFGITQQYLYENPNAFTDAIHHDDRERVEKVLAEFVKTGTFSEEYRIVKPDGEIGWMMSNAFPVKNDIGEVVRYAGIVTDITTQKIVEQDLIKAKEKAEESDRLKSAFLATINHELRTPLNHILGFSEIIRSNSDDADIKEFSGIIYDSGRKFLAMVEDIFNLALVEQGEVRVREQTFKLTDLFLENKNSLEEILNESEKNNDIQLVFKPDSKLLLTVITSDRLKISQVLTNLFRNAVKFTHKGEIQYGFYVDKEDKLVFFVKDTGIGIPADKLDIIFDFFRQVDDSHTRHYDGLGIGLAISRQIAHAMDGELSVKSEEGVGTTFYFSVPLVMSGKVEKASKPCAAADACKFSNNTVLIAEDDEDSLILVRHLLKQTEIRILTAVNGQEAVELYAANPGIDLVLMDLKMPEMDGYEATRRIKAVNAEVPVLALTAYGLVKDQEKALAAGCDDVITKPVDRDLLLHTMKKYLGVE